MIDLTTWVGFGLQFAIGLVEPLIVVVGLVLVRAQLRHLPRTSLVATAGLGLMLVAGVIGLLPTVLLVVTNARDGFAHVGPFVGLTGLLGTLLFAVGLALVIGAVLSDRSPAPADRTPPSATV